MKPQLASLLPLEAKALFCNVNSEIAVLTLGLIFVPQREERRDFHY